MSISGPRYFLFLHPCVLFLPKMVSFSVPRRIVWTLLKNYFALSSNKCIWLMFKDSVLTLKKTHTRYKFQSNITIYCTKYSYSNMFRLYWVIIRPSKEQIQCIKEHSGIPKPDDDSREEACCHKNILSNKLLCLAEIYTLYESDKPVPVATRSKS